MRLRCHKDFSMMKLSSVIEAFEFYDAKSFNWILKDSIEVHK